MSKTTETKVTRGFYSGRYNVICDGHRVGWVIRDGREWSAYVIAALSVYGVPAGSGECIDSGLKTRRQAVDSIECVYMCEKDGYKWAAHLETEAERERRDARVDALLNA